MRVLQRLGHPGSPPGDRPGRGPTHQGRAADGTPGGDRIGRMEPVEDGDQLGPRPGGADGGVGQGLGQGHAAEVGHAHQVQAGLLVHPVRVDGDDVGVLQPGERLRLARAVAGDLQRHRPVRELTLLGQEDAGEGPPAQLLDEAEAGDRLPGLGKGGAEGRRRVEFRGLSRADQAVDVEHPAEARRHLGESRHVGAGIGGLARLLPQAEFLVDQGHPGVAVELRMPIEIPLDRHHDVRLATQGEVGPEQCQQRARAFAGFARQEVARVRTAAPGPAPGHLVPTCEPVRRRGRRLIPGLARGGQAQGLVPPGGRVMGGFTSRAGWTACRRATFPKKRAARRVGYQILRRPRPRGDTISYIVATPRGSSMSSLLGGIRSLLTDLDRPAAPSRSHAERGNEDKWSPGRKLR